jgi:PleD family two-component response regulator
LNEIGVLILDDNLDSCQALHHLLDSEGWRVHFITDSRQALSTLANGVWNLVIANVELALPKTQLFSVLAELAHAEGVTLAPETAKTASTAAKRSSSDSPVVRKRRLRVLFVVPGGIATDVVPALEREELPYAIRPYHLHDLYEKISDLLVESGAITELSLAPRFEAGGRGRGRKKATAASKTPSMFASRQDYQMTEEEIAEYERSEEEERRKKSKKNEGRGSW